MTLDQLINDALYLKIKYPEAANQQVVYAGPHYVETGGQREVADGIDVVYDVVRHQQVVLIRGEGMTPVITTSKKKKKKRNKKK